MILNINGTTYEFIRKFLAFNIVTHGGKMVREQEESIQKMLEKNSNMYVFNDGVHFLLCREIEEANYREIFPELTKGESNEKI